MKIDAKVKFPNESSAERISGRPANNVAPAPKGGSQGAGFSPGAGEDTVSLSGTHGEAQRLRSVIAQVPDVRAEQIAALQGKVQSGNYKPDSQKIADALISEQNARKFKV